MNGQKSFISKYKTRLDIILSESISDISRSRFKKMIKDGLVSVNDNIVRKGKFIVNINDKIAYYDVNNGGNNGKIIPEKIKLNIVYEDENVLVINKPQGLVVHPGIGNLSGTLLNGVIFKLRFKDNSLFQRPGIVHRLDKDTSGVIIVAKNEKTLNLLIDQFKSRLVKKKYIVIVKGRLSLDNKRISRIGNNEFVISGFIKRSSYDRKKFTLSDRGKESLTYFKIIRYIGNDFTILEAYPKTGRTHQIRVHLKSINYPILGDRIYSRSKVQNMLLHAYSITLKIPNPNGKGMVLKNFKAAPPAFWFRFPYIKSKYGV